jgi:restriction system protein
MKSWQSYQHEAASHFRSLGLNATVDATIRGVRTSHDVDVLVKSNHAGFEVTWIVECKRWKSPISKLHVLALREIVADTGADRGILLSEEGFQSGAIEAANLTNVQVTSIAVMRETASDAVHAMRLRDLYDRVTTCKARYWEIPKEQRIQCGLRPDVTENTYSGARMIDICNDLLTRTFRGTYPFQIDTVDAILIFGRDRCFQSAEEVLEFVQKSISELERKLDECERGTRNPG